MARTRTCGSPRWLPVAAAVLVFGLLGTVVADEAAVGGQTAQAVEKVCSQLVQREGQKFWSLAGSLEGLGKEAIPALRGKLKAEEKVRVACAKTLLSLGDVDDRAQAIAALEDLARSASDKAVKVASIEILGENGDPDEVLPVLEKIFDDSVDPTVVIPLARVLWDVDRVAKARDRLVSLLGSQDVDVKREAALALAETDYFEGDVREVLRTLKRDPTAEGRRAASLDRILRLSRQIDRGLEKGEVVLEGTDAEKLIKLKEQRIRELEDRLERGQKSPLVLGSRTPMDAVLDEVILVIQRSYVDEAKTERAKLILNALRGMVHSLDDFSSFMDADDTKSFKQSISGEYFGIGAQVGKSAEGPLEILRPVYGGPAYKSGIHSGDRVLEVDGVRVDEIGIDEIIQKLKGPPGSRVTLRIARRGWDAPRTFEVERRMVEVPSVYYEIMPGKIGYLQLTQFGERSAEEFVTALDDLEKQGMAGLILDLRGNPGGLLDAAIRIVDEFVSDNKMPIVTQKGRGKKNDSGEVATYARPGARTNYPFMILVNGRSASASEIVSGALKDFGRATLIGKRTFGKGSVQRLISLSSEAQKALGGEAQLRLTVQYYFLPLGRCIHTIRNAEGAIVEEGGVEPDIEVADEKLPGWRIEERERLRSNPLLLDYVDKNWGQIRELFTEGDARDTGKYPEFDALYKALETTALTDDVRSLIRYHVRRRLEDERGKEFACDIQEDLPLQRAIFEVLSKLGERPQDYPRYASLDVKEGLNK
ncbi:MAG TPA: S41 family peptidase [Planctomycetota bacterium]|nr:S41 family peptidase [Planctomycetota bacterium]